MELPPYRIPTLYGVIIHTWDRVWQFIKKAGTIIFAISILMWVFMSFPRLPEDIRNQFAHEKAKIKTDVLLIRLNLIGFISRIAFLYNEAPKAQHNAAIMAQISPNIFFPLNIW